MIYEGWDFFLGVLAAGGYEVGEAIEAIGVDDFTVCIEQEEFFV